MVLLVVMASSKTRVILPLTTEQLEYSVVLKQVSFKSPEAYSVKLSGWSMDTVDPSHKSYETLNVVMKSAWKVAASA